MAHDRGQNLKHLVPTMHIERDRCHMVVDFALFCGFGDFLEVTENFLNHGDKFSDQFFKPRILLGSLVLQGIS